MPPTNPISIPAGYAPAFAIGYSDESGELAVVHDAKPLPVALSDATPISVQNVNLVAPAPLTGTVSADVLAGPFVAVPGRPVILTLSGTWEGSVQVERSTDGGLTRHKLTAGGLRWGHYSLNACEAVWSEAEDGAQLWLDIAVTSGTVDYRVSQ